MEIRPSLIAELVKREFSGRYRGSSAGILWAFLQPLFLLAVYTLAFGVILQARWGGTGDSVEFAFLLFSGLIVFNAFSECLNRAPTLIVGHPNFVKKVVFPLEILSWVVTITVLLHALIGTGIWLLGYLLLFGLPHPTFLLFPFVLLAFFPVLLGIGWLLSALGVILRDIGQITGLVSHILLFLTPIFYSIESAPSFLRPLFWINPLTFLVEQYRNILYFGRWPDLPGLLLYFMAAQAFAWLSLKFFRRLRPNFADLL